MFKILIAEDDSKIAGIILENIKKWSMEGYIVEDFSNILCEFSDYKPHLVLMDINLPYYDGFYWCQKIREVSKVPVIFLSSRSTNMDIIMAVNMGGDDYLTKPFSLEVLLAKINALLRRTYSYTSIDTAVLEHREVILNLSDGTLSYKDKKIELTKNEFKILALLMKNNGKVVSRDKIMRSLWEDESFVDDNTLTVNINRLRKKLKDLGIDEFIQTKINQGYIVV